ncbi:MAG: glycerophosphodiester phosphodiesterase [Microbacteriaceae bacterium]
MATARTRNPKVLAGDSSRSPLRLAPAVAITLALVLIATITPNASTVFASNVFGALRTPGDPAFVAGHRGDRAAAPENTIPALQSALDSALDFVETDVQLTHDGIPVLFHDETVDRTTNGRGLLAEHTFESLRALDAGSWYSEKYAGTVVPTFEEFLGIFSNSEKKALIELKGFWTAEEVTLVTDLIYSFRVHDRVTLASFNFGTLENIEEMAPAIPRVIIRRMLPADPVGLAQFYGAIAILTSPASLEENPEAVTDMHAAGLGLLLYTLNNEEKWSEAIGWGVDGIITDKPSSLDRWLAETAPGT